MQCTYGPNYRSKTGLLTAVKTSRMAGPILEGQHRTAPHPRTDSPSQRRQPQTIIQREQRTIDETPLPASLVSHRLPSHPTVPADTPNFELGPSARGASHNAPDQESRSNIAERATRESSGDPDKEREGGALLSASVGSIEDGGDDAKRDPSRQGGGGDKGKGRARVSDVAKPGLELTVDTAAEDGPIWREPFEVKWIRKERLPFAQLRHLRNPWNHNREVKVSRDGTELEPVVGRALLDEWDRVETSLPSGRTDHDAHSETLKHR